MDELPVIPLMRGVTQEDWIRFGIEQGFCGPPVCATHDGLPTTAEEDEAWLEDEDICQHVIRPYASQVEKDAIEENHSPSVWRDTWTSR
jgi:hypothetical protein